MPGTPGVPAEGPAPAGSTSTPPTTSCPAPATCALAVGRDYGDVTPLRGVIRGGGGSHTLSVAVRTRVLEPHRAAARELLV